jgi:hypothetical protein
MFLWVGFENKKLIDIFAKISFSTSKAKALPPSGISDRSQITVQPVQRSALEEEGKGEKREWKTFPRVTHQWSGG